MFKEITYGDLEGVKIGHYTDSKNGTGTTAIIFENGAVASISIKGSAPATIETDLLEPTCSVERINGISLSGGSSYGLSAASGIMKYLEERGIGLDTGFGIVPIVCGASLFDLVVGDQNIRPTKEMGYLACEAAFGKEGENLSNGSAKGNVGGGTGATIGKYLGVSRMTKGGLGTYGVKVGDLTVFAIVLVNALGDIFDLESGKIIGGILREDGKSLGNTILEMTKNIEKKAAAIDFNTTIGAVITNGKLNKTTASKVAAVTHNAYGKVIYPVHTSMDGDGIFVASTGDVPCDIDTLGAISTHVMAKAINEGVRNAKGDYGLLASEDF